LRTVCAPGRLALSAAAEVAITGGTGRYDGARRTARVTGDATHTRTRVVIRLRR
jgi:hypothetical protein